MDFSHITCKLVVIDTQTYAGNFERELCAWVTGMLGPSSVGEHYAKKAQAQMEYQEWWEENIAWQEKELGTEVDYPATIWVTPGINNYGKLVKQGENPHPLAYFSVAIFVEEFPPEAVLEEMIARVKDFCHNPYALCERESIRAEMGIQKMKHSLQFTGVRFLEPELKTEYVPVEKVEKYHTIKIK